MFRHTCTQDYLLVTHLDSYIIYSFNLMCIYLQSLILYTCSCDINLLILLIIFIIFLLTIRCVCVSLFYARYISFRVLLCLVCLYVVFFYYLNNYIIYLQLIIIIIKWYFISLYSLNSLCGVRGGRAIFFSFPSFEFILCTN